MSITGEVQAEIFQNVIDERPISINVGEGESINEDDSRKPSRIKGLVTDNAAVMRKTWRILKRNNPTFYAYGCITHCFNLLNKDIYKLLVFKNIMQKTRKITTWFSRHAQDLSIFRRICIDKTGKEKALIKAGATRFGSETTSVESCVKAMNDLKITVADPLWNDNKESKKMKVKARDIRNLIMDTEYWRDAKIIHDFLAPLNAVICQLQSDKLPFGMGYHSFISLYSYFANYELNDIIDDDIQNAVLDMVMKRLDFLITPAHVASYLLTPHYVKKCTITLRAATAILEKALEGMPTAQIDAAKDAYVNFRASYNDVSFSQCWSDRELSIRSPSQWWAIWGLEPEFQGCQESSILLHNLLLAACGSERNWSDQKYIRASRRSKLKDTLADKLVNIYSNGELVDNFATASDLNKGFSCLKSKAGKQTDDRVDYLKLLSHCDQHPTFVHVNFNTIHSPSEFDGMHEDDAAEDGYNDDDENDSIASEVVRNIDVDNESSENEEDDIHEEYVGDILPCPEEVPKGLKENVRIAVYFDDEFDKGWFEGILQQVHKGKKRKENCTAKFEDGIANFIATKENYGRKVMWVLLPEITTNDAEIDDDNDIGEI